MGNVNDEIKHAIPKTKKCFPIDAIGQNVIARGSAKVSSYDMIKVKPEDGIPMQIMSFIVYSVGDNDFPVSVGDEIQLSSPPIAQVSTSDFNPQTVENWTKKFKRMRDDEFASYTKKHPKVEVIEFYAIPNYNIIGRRKQKDEK